HMKYALHIFLSLFFLSNTLFAQVDFSLMNTTSGIDHYYGTPMLMGGGSAIFDYDNDDDLDIWMTGGTNGDALWSNNGDGTFTNMAILAGLGDTWTYTTNSVNTADIDNDGDRDVFITTAATASNHLFMNNGDGTFTDATSSAGLIPYIAWSTSASFGDYNLDGFLDLYVGNYVEDFGFAYDSLGVPYGFAHKCTPNWLFLNNGDFSFTELTGIVVEADSGCVLATAWTDFDRDYDIDLLIANDFGEWIVPNTILRNKYPTNYLNTQYERWTGIYGMGIGIGDFDHDMDLDYYVTNIGRNRLYENISNHAFKEGTAAAGVEDILMTDSLLSIGWGTAFVDLDNDMWHELLVSNGHIPAFPFIGNSIENKNRLFYNNGDGTFTDIAPAAGVDDGGIARGLACGDFDKDGDLDVIFNNIESYYSSAPDPVLVYENTTSNGNHWLDIEVVGIQCNRDGFGTQIEIFVGGESWVDEVSGGSSHSSQNQTNVHFGLGANTMVDELNVIWPGGRIQTLTDISADQTLVVIEDTTIVSPLLGGGTALLDIDRKSALEVRPNPVINDTRIRVELAAAGEVIITIFDPTGRSVALLYKGWLSAGQHEFKWDIKDASGKRLSPGTYIASVQTQNEQMTAEIMVVR
ncbi:MAG: hypothetical protein ACI959_001133, partial [Limisphaerales bacterium]